MNLASIGWRHIWFGSGDVKMEQVDQYSYYKLGKALAEFEDTPVVATPFSAVFLKLFQIQVAVQEFEKSPCTHSKSAAKDIGSAITSLFGVGFQKDDNNQTDMNKPLQPWQFSDLSRAIKDFESNFARESPTLPIFFVPQKGISKTDDLIDRAEKDFPEPIREQLPSRVIEEIQQGGKALAFDLFTANSFHMMRAAELVMLNLLRDYYSATIPESGRNWGNYISILKIMAQTRN